MVAPNAMSPFGEELRVPSSSAQVRHAALGSSLQDGETALDVVVSFVDGGGETGEILAVNTGRLR